jgi:hypothetical protein
LGVGNILAKETPEIKQNNLVCIPLKEPKFALEIV